MILGRITVTFLLLAVLGCTSDQDGTPREEEIAGMVLRAPIPEPLQSGEAAFDAHCSACHGNRALGTSSGPPLVHIVYEPSHHSDAAFLLAVQRGVRAHHWGYGDMPPLPAVSREEIEEITAYVRYLQRLAGID